MILKIAGLFGLLDEDHGGTIYQFTAYILINKSLGKFDEKEFPDELKLLECGKSCYLKLVFVEFALGRHDDDR